MRPVEGPLVVGEREAYRLWEGGTNKLESLLGDLGMPNAKFEISVSPSTSYNANGKDVLHFLFAANKGGNFGELKKVASGGELSRIMLSIKKILSTRIK